jgi:hypothetical protein
VFVNCLNQRRILAAATLLAGGLALAACGGKGGEAGDTAVRSTPQPLAIAIPPQPGPPMGASPTLTIPPRSPAGVRQTVNTAISAPQKLWNLRSAYNVAALNCQDPRHAPILAGYRTFLTSHARTLTAANRALEQEFKTRYGTGFARTRDVYMTQVYNYYALPVTLAAFCDAALAMNAEVQGVKSADLEAFAGRMIPEIDRVFEYFFLSYEQYRTDLSGWQARYAPPPAAVSLSPFPALPGAQPAPQGMP